MMIRIHEDKSTTKPATRNTTTGKVNYPFPRPLFTNK